MIIAEIVLQLSDRVVTVRYVADDMVDTPDDRAGLFYYLTEGNFGCDCNRSSYIRAQIDSEFAEMECGDTITLVALRFNGERIEL